MFPKEARGLQLLRNADAFTVPEVYNHGEVDNYSYLLIEFLPESEKASDFGVQFGVGLAKLHQSTQDTFGLDEDNYIGSLMQYNKSTLKNAAEFYIEKRLEPQFRLAAQNGFSFKKLDDFYDNIRNEIPDEPPSLVHGDLWGGNYMVTVEGKPALIDPAVAYAPREMDLGMMQLFGGFSEEVFSHYNTTFPLESNWKERVEIWQLYYILVHLNLFGTGYLPSVKRIIKQYV